MRYVSVCSGVEAATVAWKPLGWTPVWFSEIEPFPCEVLKYHYPDVPNLGDMTKIKVENLPDGRQRFSNGSQIVESEKVDLLVGGTPCFVEDTLVLTPFGYRKIQDLQIGDEVISHLGNICKVTAIGNKQSEVGKINILGREEIVCTDNHPFYVCSENNNFEFVEAKKTSNKFAGRIYLNEKFASDINIEYIELAGYFVGCGKIVDNSVVFQFSNEYELKKFKNNFNKRFPLLHVDLTLISLDKKLNNWIKDNFYKYNKISIPYFLYYSELQQTFVERFLDSNKNHDKIYCPNKEVAYSLGDLFGSYDVKKDKKNNKWYICENKKVKLFGDRFASKVKGFKNGNTTRTVYNITVEQDHTYIVEGIAVHNCQGFSVAGKQQGLNDERSVLALAYCRLLEEMHPRYFLWENVPGVLSTNNGNDFKEFIRKINEIGYCCAWKILDGQYCRVDGFPRAIPQRRRRMFVIGYFGDKWQCPAEILFEPQEMLGDFPPKRVKGKGFTTTVEGSITTPNINLSE